MNWLTWVLTTPSVHSILERIVLAMHKTHVQDGITIYADPKEGPLEPVYERIASARRLLDRIDPARSRQLRALMPHILVSKGIPTQFWAGTRTCCIERKYLESTSDILIANSMVHELAHARLVRHGVDVTPRSQGRVEAACIRSQIAFLNRLPRDEYPSTDQTIEQLAGVAAAGLRGESPAWMRRLGVPHTRITE